MAKKKNARARQSSIPGTERKVHKDVRAAAEQYVEARDERMECTEIEVDKKAALIKAMRKHDLTEYVDEDAELIVTLTEGEAKIKVRKLHKPEAEEAANG